MNCQWLQKILMKKPLESARVVVEDGSLAENMVNDKGTEQTTSMMISIPEASTAAAWHKLQSCICGWAKVTSTTGLKIYQDRKRCLKEGQEGTRIDSYFLRSKPCQLTEVQQQDKKHSLQNIKNPVPVEEEPGTGEQPEPGTLQPAAEKRIQWGRPLFRWPKSCKKRPYGERSMTTSGTPYRHLDAQP